MSICTSEIFGNKGHRQKRYQITKNLLSTHICEYYQGESLDGHFFLIKLCKSSSKYQELQMCKFIQKEFQSHPNLQILIESIEHRTNNLILIFENSHYFNLSSYIKTNSITLTKSLKILRDVLQGLSSLHSRGIVHLNLKLDSVFIDRKLRAKIGNFSKLRNFLLSFDDAMIDFENLPPELRQKDAEIINAGFVDIWMAGCLLADLGNEYSIEISKSLFGRRIGCCQGLKSSDSLLYTPGARESKASGHICPRTACTSKSNNFLKYLYSRLNHPNPELRACADEILLILCDSYLKSYKRKGKYINEKINHLLNLNFSDLFNNLIDSDIETIEILCIQRLKFKLWMKPHKLHEILNLIQKKKSHENFESIIKILTLIFSFLLTEPNLLTEITSLKKILEKINDFWLENNKINEYLDIHSLTLLKLLNSIINCLLEIYSTGISLSDYETLEFILNDSSPIFRYLNSLGVLMNFCMNHSKPFKSLKMFLISNIKEDIINISNLVEELKSFNLIEPVKTCVGLMKSIISSSIENYNKCYIYVFLEDQNTEYLSLSDPNSSNFKTYNSRSSVSPSEKLSFLSNFYSNLFIDPTHVTEGRLLKSGSSCSVLQGLYDSKPVAIKLLNKDSSDAFKLFHREFESYSKLVHKNIVKFYGAYKRGTYRLVFSLCSEFNLYDLLHRFKEIILNESIKYKIAIDIANAMEFVHSNGIIHRDLKSLNVLLEQAVKNTGDQVNVKVADFGSSRRVEHGRATEHVGTVHWMAPEVINGGVYGFQADVYSYGVLLWEIFMREEPYKGLRHYDILEGVSQGQLTLDLSRIKDKGVKDIIENCLSFNPQKRHNFAYLSFLLKQASTEVLKGSTAND